MNSPVLRAQLCLEKRQKLCPTCRPGIYNSDLWVKRLVRSKTRYFWHREITPSGVLSIVVYIWVQDAASAHYGFTNVVTYVPRLLVSDIMHGEKMSLKDWKWIVQTEQKTNVSMTNYQQGFAKPGQLLLKAFLEILSTAKVCLLLVKHRWVVGCERMLIVCVSLGPALFQFMLLRC